MRLVLAAFYLAIFAANRSPSFLAGGHLEGAPTGQGIENRQGLVLGRDHNSGIATYLEVITAQNAAYSNERNTVDLRVRQMTASVNLIKALGGGWTAGDLPAGAGLAAR